MYYYVNHFKIEKKDPKHPILQLQVQYFNVRYYGIIVVVDYNCKAFLSIYYRECST